MLPILNASSQPASAVGCYIKIHKECIFIFLLCFQPLFLLPVAADDSESTVLNWILAEWSLDRTLSQPCDSHSAHKAVICPLQAFVKRSLPPGGEFPHVHSNRAEPSWYQGRLAINFHEHWFLHFRAIFVSLSALVFNFPADIFPFPKRNTKPWAAEMHQNCSLEKQVGCLASCFSQQKFTDVSVNCFNAQKHLSRAVFHKRQAASLPSPAQTKWLLPSLWAQSSVLARQSWHLQIHSWQLQQVKMFLQMVLNWFPPLQEWEDGQQLFNSFRRSNTQQLQKKCG